MYLTISFASSVLRDVCGAIGISPHEPDPPLMILLASISIVASVASYLLATST